MPKTITGTYDSAAQVKNVLEDLIATGIDREKVFVDNEKQELKVMVPTAIEPEILEILKRHNPGSVHSASSM